MLLLLAFSGGASGTRKLVEQVSEKNLGLAKPPQTNDSNTLGDLSPPRQPTQISPDQRQKWHNLVTKCPHCGAELQGPRSACENSQAPGPCNEDDEAHRVC